MNWNQIMRLNLYGAKDHVSHFCQRICSRERAGRQIFRDAPRCLRKGFVMAGDK